MKLHILTDEIPVSNHKIGYTAKVTNSGDVECRWSLFNLYLRHCNNYTFRFLTVKCKGNIERQWVI